MLCQNCNKNEANSHIHSVVNGVVNDVYLCSECAKKYNKSFSNDDFFGLFSSLFKESNTPNQRKQCECCKASFDEISKSGKVGCANCYKTFLKELEPALLRLHGRTSHVGKRLDNLCNNTAEIKENKVDEVATLKAELKEAILKEEYEKAAILRDKIKEKTGEK